MILVDSVSALIPRMEMERDMGDPQVGSQARARHQPSVDAMAETLMVNGLCGSSVRSLGWQIFCSVAVTLRGSQYTEQNALLAALAATCLH